MTLQKLAKRIREDDGQAMVEFALIFPFLMLLIVGIVEFGRAWNVAQTVTDAAREGARNAVIADPDIDQDSVTFLVKDRLARAAVDANAATVGFDPLSNWKTSGTPMTVEVTAPYRFTFFGPLIGWASGSETITIRSAITMRNE
jgi:Flp pilus assembly pilin Flp